MIKIEQDMVEVEVKKEVVVVDEAVVNEVVAVVQVIKDDCESDLVEVIFVLESVISVLNILKFVDIILVKFMKVNVLVLFLLVVYGNLIY